jgi:hypothetical protein
MNGMLRFRVAPCAVLLVAALTLDAAPTAAQQRDPYAGLSLVDALQLLQDKGLRIVFTSATVTPDLRVRVPPRGRTPRQQLDELLAQHGLEARAGPGGTIQVVRAQAVTPKQLSAPVGTIEGTVVHALTSAPLAGVVVQVTGTTGESRTDAAGRFFLRDVGVGRRSVRASLAGYAPATTAVRVSRDATTALTVRLSPTAGTHSEHVTVSRPRLYREDRGVASETSLDRAQAERLYGSLADDPIRAVQTFPRVWAIDEFRSDFAVRGSPFRHVDLVVEGASTHWLQHTAHGRGATGSLAMLAGPVLESATLQAGAYPRRYGDRLGPQLDLALREGSREQFQLRTVLGGINATLLGEGPLGRAPRGSWLVTLRHSLLEWPAVRPESMRTAFGFSDGLAKLVYDVRPSQQFAVSALSGVSSIDAEDNASPDELGDGTNRASMVNVSWRSTFGSAFVLTQRAYVVTQHFLNKTQNGQDRSRGANEEVVYRAAVARPVAGGLLDAGAQIGRADLHDGPHFGTGTELAGSAWVRSGYAHFAWDLTPSLTLSPGLRVTDSSLLDRATVTRWVLGEWTFRGRWTLTASAGVSHQFPDLHHAVGNAGSQGLRPERAAQFDVAIEQRVTRSVRWQATLYSRREEDILREPDVYPRLLDGAPTPPAAGRYANILQGSSRGLELLIDRRSATGLSGWAAYAYGRSRFTDTERHETYWADLDQRHAFNLFAVYRFGNGAGVGATYRAGSSFPIPGYFETRGPGLFVSDRRNHVRLPVYSRLDLRADCGFVSFGRRLTLFGEVLNVLNRRNAGVASGSVDLATGRATGFTNTPFRRRASAGLRIDF